MSKKNAISLAIVVLLFGILASIGSFAFWSWASDTPKNIVFNTAKNLSEYINYDEGESAFVGDLQISDSYEYGIHSTISISKKYV